MVAHVERCLDRFTNDLPPDYRDRPLPEQPDIVWGELVLPNFRDTLKSLNEGHALLAAGDFQGLDHANGPLNDSKGQQDFGSGWMRPADEATYGMLLNRAVMMAMNIQATEAGYWAPGDLTTDYDAGTRGPMPLLPHWPVYRTSPTVQVRTGEPLTRTGIFLPDIPDSCAQFLHAANGNAPQTLVRIGLRDLSDASTGEKYGIEPQDELRDCTWILVERSGEDGPVVAPSSLDTVQLRITGGSTCPRTGFWLTPASTGSRRRFVQGETMPSFESAYGATLWQWDGDQS
ncbi:hypothetical protein IP91_00300 [Pseudoduganella lurida]|uniref:Uncharacterized protein n=2 Tax=Pseudoduganella lurida TaxID=1036180 RepID=A0A562RKV4_9BURK|nr:hypothetical protein IP91_00300 [Pseudoduganella lurida]